MVRYLCCGLLLATACKTERMNTPDAPSAGPEWWSPKNGEVKNWDLQLAAPIDVSSDRAMYDLDLWSLVPAATMLDYGDGDPVAVPAGSLAGTIEQLHARASKPIVVCHVGIGSLSLSDPDARKFPGFEANPPDNPTAPKAGSVVGWTVDADPKVRFIDIRTSVRTMVDKIVWQRFELAKQIGCDGVEGSDIERGVSNSGWTIGPEDIYGMYASVASEAHDRKLSAGMKNGDATPSAIDMGATKLDWLMIERCGENMDCDLSQPFFAADKEIFAIDYNKTFDGMPQASAGVCNQQVLARIPSGLYKDVPPTNAVRTQCSP